MSRRFLTAEWRSLVMLNYEVEPSVLRPLVPKGTELDPWDGRYFVSLVGFLFLHTRVLGVPVPCHRSFEEVNLRFYVRRTVPDGPRRAVAFIKEVVPRAALAAVARWVYNENYVARRMASTVRLPDEAAGQPGLAEFRWQQKHAWYGLRADFTGRPAALVPGSEEEFITEHYWGYVPQRDGSTLEYRVEHPSWRVWRATQAAVEGDLASFYGEPYRAALSRPPSSAFVAEGSPVAVYRGETVPP
jgi:uncharacterized protein YqjF (DUF2071 family)